MRRYKEEGEARGEKKKEGAKKGDGIQWIYT